MSDLGGESPPRVFVLDGPELLRTRRRVFDADEALAAADQRLLEEAEAATGVGPFAVVDKEAVPPSGDKHDYLSHGTYWWPDPDEPDGLPYVRRDGEANPERELHDYASLTALFAAVDTLSTAFFYSDYERFAERAGLLLRTWFLDPATRMHPHLEFGQAIPGVCDGRGIGIIDTMHLASLVDAVGLLGGAGVWTGEDQRGLEAWCVQYLDWLVGSDMGRDEASQPNNHGTWYDVQVLSLALFIGDDSIGQRVAKAAAERLEAQVEANGEQPQELKRTRSLDYALMNLTGLFDLADLATNHGHDLWAHQGADGRCLRRALDWLVDNALDSEWIRPQITPSEPSRWIVLLRRAANRFGDPGYEERIARLGVEAIDAQRTNLLYPAPNVA